MAGKAAAPGTAVLLVTANVGSLFDDPENLQKNWLREFYQVLHTHKPHFMALHCQEFGGKNYEASMSHVDKFVKELLSSDAMKEYNRARVYLDENYKSQEHFTALGSFYFLHESLKNIYQFDFKAKKYKKVTGKEIYSDTLESTPMLEKEKFPQDYFPEVCEDWCLLISTLTIRMIDEAAWIRNPSAGSRNPINRGLSRGRMSANGQEKASSGRGGALLTVAFDLVNIHLFHDASNLVAWETSPSVYSGVRHKALGYVLDRIIDQRFEKVSYFVFGDFNFRLDSKSVVETLCTKATMQTVRAADTNEVVKLIFRESDNDRKVVLQLEKKLFDYFNQDVFRDNNGTALLEFDKELSVFKDRLYELDISFPPSYPYSEDSSQGEQYMNTRCPAWCDRILMSLSAKELVLKSESEEKVATYDHIGPNVCMGDHKPVFLAFRIAPGAEVPAP
ncbi:Inositol polyphosphate-5-phosphatase A [Apodemus speciosus]|uniref:inositol-polyphosphate 5-phosphatase n=1 Tax=Apodemus speciosus TaxID=105296 RepID=A0ABQ0F0M8_APOSI